MAEVIRESETRSVRAASPAVTTVVIEPRQRWSLDGLRELWQHRELMLLLAWRDIKVRYKQTALGVAWVVLQPIINMILFSLIFGQVAHLPSDGLPYPIFTFAALVPWTYFSYVLVQSGGSVVANVNMVSKVYFPRVILPLAAAVAGLVDFAAATAVLLVMMLTYGVHFGEQMLLLPLFLALGLLTSLSVGLWLSALNVRYRDIKYATPVIAQIWLFASPIAYSPQVVTGRMALVYTVNPMVGIIEGFRWCFLGIRPPSITSIATSLAISILLFIGGCLYFRHMEHEFADVI